MPGPSRLIKWVIGVGAGLVLGLVAYGVLSRQTLSWTLAAAGSGASLSGLAFIVVQLWQLIKISEATQAAISDTHDYLRRGISIGDVSKTLKIMEEVQQYAGQRKYEMATIRLQDARSLLIRIRMHGSFGKGNPTDQFDGLITDVGLDLINLHDACYSADVGFDSRNLTKTLEALANILVRFESQLTYERGE